MLVLAGFSVVVVLAVFYVFVVYVMVGGVSRFGETFLLQIIGAAALGSIAGCWVIVVVETIVADLIRFRMHRAVVVVAVGAVEAVAPVAILVHILAKPDRCIDATGIKGRRAASILTPAISQNG